MRVAHCDFNYVNNIIPKGVICFIMSKYHADQNPAVFADRPDAIVPKRWKHATQAMLDVCMRFAPPLSWTSIGHG
jgi:hypothetical protein